MKPVTFIVLVVALFLLGCARRPGDRYEIVVDPSDGVVLADDVSLAASMWESKVPVKLDVVIAAGCQASDGRICVHSASHNELMRVRDDNDSWAATRFPPLGSFGRPDGADVYVDNTSDSEAIWPTRLHIVIAHELGHAMGLEHTGQDTLMCGMNWCMSDHVTDTDAQQWHTLRR